MSDNLALKRLGFVNGRDYVIEMVYPPAEEGEPPPAGVPTRVWLSEEPEPSPSEIADALAEHEAALYRDARAAAYTAELGKDPLPNQIRTIGDVLDTLITQVEIIRQHSGASASAAWTEMLGKIAAIKATHPKPE